MSRFMSKRHVSLEPYIPGEQPREMNYIKLNTNESPFSPTKSVLDAVNTEVTKLNLYSDPECSLLRQAASRLYGVKPENILPVNGSDEILYFAFMAFGDEDHPFSFPDISYGFYPVYADVNNVVAHTIPLANDFSINYKDYCALNENIVIANPNAPTGLLMPLWQIEEIVRTNPDNVVIIDEAYIDFGGESCVSLIDKYDNLLVTQTFSKSRSLAGARLGFGIAGKSLMQDLYTIKNSVNPYNINRMTQAAGIAAINDNTIYMENCRKVVDVRDYASEQLRLLGFNVLPSYSNFIFVSCNWIDGCDLYKRLKQRGILVRHFDKPRISNYCRITIGTKQQIEILLDNIQQIKNEIEV